MGLRSWIIWKGANIGYGLASKLFWPRASAVALVEREDKLLAVDTGSYLMLPGGGLEYGESFSEAAKREAREETGYDVRIKDEVKRGINSVGGVEMFFDADLVEQEKVGESSWEGDPIWVELDEIDDRK